MAKTSPTQRTLKELRTIYGKAVTVQIVERWCSFSKRRIDLFGFIDVLALIGPNTVGIQTTSATNHAARLTKICEEPRARAWLNAGNLIELWSWKKERKSGRWIVRKQEITLANLDNPPAEPADKKKGKPLVEVLFPTGYDAENLCDLED